MHTRTISPRRFVPENAMRITSTFCLLSLFFIGCGEVTEPAVSETSATDAAVSQAPAETPSAAIETDAVAENARVAGSVDIVEYQPVTLEVPTMMCPFACYPTVKETLEEQPGVASVDLVPQKKEGEIDDRRVIVKVKEGFNADEAIAALTKAGYENAVVEN